MTSARHTLILSFLCIVWMVQTSSAQSVGDILPPHLVGGLDIHHINTGEGSAAFFILPDETTMLIDCGYAANIKRPPGYKSPRVPDESRLPGEWVARYIQKYHPQGAKGALDYFVVTHFHADHLSGLPDLARQVEIRRVIDRSWPDYQKPTAFEGDEAAVYQATVKAQVEKYGTQLSRFKAGVNDQIVLVKEPAKYPGFEVRNLAVNGEVWTGTGTEVRQRFPAGEVPNENESSLALRLRYGRFDYFSGGDLPGVPGGEVAKGMPLIAARMKTKEWRDMESALAWVTGPVDVLLLNHHGGQDTTNAFFLSVLRPRVSLAQVWATPQITPEVLARLQSENIYPGPRDIFTTNGLWEGRKEHLIKQHGEEEALRHIANLGKITATQGHIVIRVAPGGDSYHVYVLDDSEESFRIRSVHGEYECR